MIYNICLIKGGENEDTIEKKVVLVWSK